MELAETSLRRLLPAVEAEKLLVPFTSLMPGQQTAILDADGAMIVHQGLISARGWAEQIWTVLQHKLADDETSQPAAGQLLAGEPVCLEDAVCYSLSFDGQILGWLIVDAPTPVGVGAALQSILVLLLKERIEKRRLARETLDRYREVNLLYHLAERFGASLEVGEILQIALSEAQRVIHASCGVVWLTAAAAQAGAQAAYFGRPEETQPLKAFLHRLLGENPNILSPDIVTHLGDDYPLANIMYAPLVVRGTLLGLFALGKRDGQAEFTAGEEKLLLALAGQAASAVEKARFYQQELEHQQIVQELAIGQRIQRSLLPKAMPDIPGWEFAACYQAANQVGGDFYDVFLLPGETGCQNMPHFGLTIADVAGKGIPAALMMAFAQGILHTAAYSHPNDFTHPAPGDVLHQTNLSILQSSHSGLLLTAFFAVLDPCTGRLSYANGGHEPPILYRAAVGEYQELTCGQSLLLGARREQHFKAFEILMEPGDLLLLYTDGVTEARNSSGAFFAEERLYSVLAQHAGSSCSDLLSALKAALAQFTAVAVQSDDITLLALRRL